MDFCLQLYSARNFQPWKEVFQETALLGYTQVEGFEELYPTLEAAQTVRDLLDQYDLDMPSGHFDLKDLEENLDQCIKIAVLLGMHTIFAPYLTPEQRPTTKREWTIFAHRLEHMANTLKHKGFHFGWHNHDFEFKPLPDGTIPMELIISEAPTVEWEVDAAWIIKAGLDPLDWIEAHGTRITAVHIKDIAPEGEGADEDGWADVGFGTVPWAHILTALQEKSRTKIYILEHDDPNNFLRFADRSLTSLKMLEGV